MRLLIVSIALLALSTASRALTSFDLRAQQGVFGVGLQVIQQYDKARQYQRRDATVVRPKDKERRRPLQTMVWYPTRDAGRTVTNADYLRWTRSDDDFGLSPQEIETKLEAWITARSTRMSQAAVRSELKQIMTAQLDASPAPGKYPLIVYAPGFGSTATENAELCEYLASQGYVVMSSASIGSASRAMTLDLDGIEAQVADIQFLITSANSNAQVDHGQIAVIGFSWGGLSNIVAAARDGRIRALVNLDGAVRYAPAFVNSGAGAVNDVSPERISVPLLFLGARAKSLEELSSEKIDTSFSFMNGMSNSDVYIATMRPMRHFDFASQLLRFTSADLKDEYSRHEVLDAFGWAVRYIHAFLDAHLKNSAPARAFLMKSPEDHGAPAHMMTLVRRPAGSLPAK